MTAFALLAAACFAPAPLPEPSSVERGAVVSEHPRATQVGLEVLARGGNAADAAVATALALAVVYPQAGNLGGGGFALFVPAHGDALAVDFRETAPAGTRSELYLDAAGRFVPQRATSGALAIAIPGSPRGLHELHERCGSGALEFHDLVAPAIRLAREGFRVDSFLADDLAEAGVRERMNERARSVFFPGGEPLREGDLLVQPELASTLAAYASRGPAAFYRGRIAEAVVLEILRAPVPGSGLPPADLVTTEELRRYQTHWVPPLRGSFRGYELLTMPPPSSGGLIVLQVLGMLEGLPLESARREPELASSADPLSERMVHWWIEAMRRAFADRAQHMGDPDFHDVPIDDLLAPEWIAARRVSIGERAELEVGPWPGAAPAESPQTTHLSVIDREGNAVALTTTLNNSFGSGVMVEGCGFLLNNEMDDFAIRAGEPHLYGLVGSNANSPAPGKRPLSSMCPTVVRGPGGELRLVLGSPGGPRIVTSVLQVLLRVLVLEQSLADAVRAPRLHQQWRPVATVFEDVDDPRWDRTLLEELAARGHPIELQARTFGSVQAIRIGEAGDVEAVSDPRRGGAAGIEGR